MSWELPDPLFITTECTLVPILAERYFPQRASDINSACHDVRTGRITPDEWLLRFNPAAREVDANIPCPTCVSIMLPPRRAIPQGFNSYVLFLVPSAESLLETKYGQIAGLVKAFSEFGESIGDSRAAVWLSSGRAGFLPTRSPGKSIPDLIAPQPADTLRSKSYCDRFGLAYNDGPYVLAMKKRPDLMSRLDEYVIIRLHGLEPERIIRVLTVLSEDLRRNHDVRRRALLYEEVKQRILAILHQHLDVLKGVVGAVAKGIV